MTENVNVTQAAPMQAPLLPIRDLVVFPHTVLPLFIGRPLTIRSVRTAMNGDRTIALVTQKESGRDDPKLEDLYKTGTLARVLQMLKLPDGTLKVLVEADERIDIQSISSNPKDGYSATFTPHPCVVQGCNRFVKAQLLCSWLMRWQVSCRLTTLASRRSWIKRRFRGA